MLVITLHPRVAGLHVLVELVELVFQDEMLGHRAAAEHFDGRSAVAVTSGQQPLRDDGFDGPGQLGQKQPVLGRRKHGDDPLDGLGRVGAVDGREDLMPGVRGVQRNPQRLDVPQLANENDVGILTQRLAQRPLEGGRVGAHLELRHHRFPVRVHVLDRIFNGNDLVPVGSVDQIDHRGQRRAFSAPGRACHQDKPATGQGNVTNGLRKVQVVDRRNAQTDNPYDDADLAELAVNTASKSCDFRDGVGEVQPPEAGSVEIRPTRLRQNRDDQASCLLVRDRLHVQTSHLPGDPQRGRCPRLDVNVRCALLHGKAEDVWKVHLKSSPVSREERAGLF